MKYENYKAQLTKIADIHHAIAVLSWDKEVNLPSNAAMHRSQQVATLSGIAHEMATSPLLGESLNTLIKNTELSTKQKRNIELSLRDYNKATKFDEAFVIRRSKITSEAFHAWLESRQAEDWSIFAEKLKPLIDIKREESMRYNIGEHPYDALLDLYEPGMRVSKLDPLFTEVTERLHPLIKRINQAKQVDDSFLKNYFDKDQQWKYGLHILKIMGYDFTRGRQDISTHPFTTSFSPNDVRVSTRIDEHDFKNMLWSTIHEGGHALYEQGLPEDDYGLPSGSYVSLGIHESQSRLWENNVGRSLDFWQAHYGELQSKFEALKDVDLMSFFKAINKVEPNLIRTEADELHYHFHVMIRYNIEKALIAGDVEVSELKELWNDSYEKYLGLRPKNDNEGILQDIHWAHGSFGYFPTYSLGSFYAAQFYEQSLNDHIEISNEISQGKSKLLLDWLRRKVHLHGRQFDASELCKRITSRELDLNAFMQYAENKYKLVYNI